jgi:UDP-N-acetyl-D-mannosaminuronic acid transferase (WecB/TagA/CpsF family)
MIYPVVKLGDFFFKATPVEACRSMYGLNPFPESIKIAEYIKAHTNKDDRIAVIGSEPQIYFYANRKAATGFIYVYGLMESHDYVSKMQLEIIKEIEASRPKYVVLVTIPDSWLSSSTSDMTIIKWSDKYFSQNYITVGLIDAISENKYKAYWDEEARRTKPSSPFNLLIMERTVK